MCKYLVYLENLSKGSLEDNSHVRIKELTAGIIWNTIVSLKAPPINLKLL